jgi:2-keto-3-deoxy-L-rhamnonate aldolase RhmA
LYEKSEFKKRLEKMKRQLLTVAAVAALGIVLFRAQGQQAPKASADPYANNPDAGKMQFPLAAPAGKISGAYDKALPGATNQGAFNMDTWKYGHQWDPPPGSKIWNPVKLKLMRGEKVTGGTVFASSDPSTYCAMANAGYDFIWTEMQHSPRDWESVARMWKACPDARAVPGVRVAYTDEREIQHATDAGALVVVVPTVRSIAEGTAARDWAFFPPLGKRSTGGGQASEFYANVPGGYRNTINDNLVLVEMIETLDGVKDAREIAKLDGVSAIFAASGDLGNFSGFKQGTPDYERLINAVHDAALGAGKRLCGPFAWRDRPDFTCFQNSSETAAIARGAAQELGPLKDTQAVPEVGPWAKKH